MTIRRFYANNYNIDEKQCKKNRCSCAVVQYAQDNHIKMRVEYNKKSDIEKIGFVVQDVDAFTAKAQELCGKCK